jgi:hypothetical protein
MDYKKGDLAFFNGAVVSVKSDVVKEAGVIYIPSSSPDPMPSRVTFGGDMMGYKGDSTPLLMAMDFVGTSLLDFGDGTAILGEIMPGHFNVYSPRLPIEELVEFCKKNLDKYQKFFSDNELKIESGTPIEMTHWWEYKYISKEGRV